MIQTLFKSARFSDFSKLVFFVALVGGLLFVSGCKGKSEDPKPSKQDEVQAILISGNWRIQTVTVDGVDETDVYEGLTLRFTATNYTSTNGLPVWPASGTWVFTSDAATAFERNDGMLVEILEATPTSLKLGLAWDETTIGSGRASSVEGDHVFSFVK